MTIQYREKGELNKPNSWGTQKRVVISDEELAEEIERRPKVWEILTRPPHRPDANEIGEFGTS